MKYLIFLLIPFNAMAMSCDVIIHPDALGHLKLYSVCGDVEYQCKNCHTTHIGKYNRTEVDPIDTRKSFGHYYYDKYLKKYEKTK
jgi:hypothetical protein